MDSTKKRIAETIQQMEDKDLYSIGEAQVASDHAKEKAYTLQHEYKKGSEEQNENQNQEEKK